MENLVPPAKQSPKKQQSPSATSSESSTDDSGPTTPLQDCNVEPRPALVEQCLRPRHCSLPEGDAREWMHRRLSHLGHVFSERGAHYMACVWFELSFAAKPEAFPELINAVDMRMKLGQWKLADTLYRRLLRMELTKEERDAVYRHLGEAISLMDGIVAASQPPGSAAAGGGGGGGCGSSSTTSTSTSSSSAGASYEVSPLLLGCASSHQIATLPPPPPPNTPPSRAKANPGSQGARAAAEAELSILLAAPAMVGLRASQTERLLPLVRGCGFAANKACEFEDARRWFEASYALSAATCDLLSVAHMRSQLDPQCAIAAAAHEYVRKTGGSPDVPPPAATAGGRKQGGNGVMTKMIAAESAASASAETLVSNVLTLARLEERFVRTWGTLATHQDTLQATLEEHAHATQSLREEIGQLRHLLAAKYGDGDGGISGGGIGISGGGISDGGISAGCISGGDISAGGISAGGISAEGGLTSKGVLVGPCSPSDQPPWQRLRQASDQRSLKAISFRPAAASPQGGSDCHSSVSIRVPSPSSEAPGDSAHGGSACACSPSLSPQFERAQSKRRLGRVEEEPSDDPGREWELIEGDQDVNAMLKDVRGRIDEYFVKNARNEPTMADFGAEGTLYVQLISATGLVAADSNGLSDPYCKLDLGGQRQRSRKLYETLDPVWHNEIFTFAGVLGQVVNEPLKVSVWDFDLSSVDDMLGEAEIELADHAYCNGIRREIISSLEPQGEVRIQVWWEPEGEEDRLKQGGQRRGGRGPNKAPSFMARLKAFLLERVIPEKFQTLRGCCGVICFPVLHPESRFCSTWNVVLAFFILYCAIAVPLEIAFESDMVRAFCTKPEDPFGPQIYRQECNSFQLWFWLNFLVDVWFMIDITINFRTGYMHEGHFVNDDWPVMKAYLTGAFGLDVAGTIPLGIIQMLTNPDNPFGDEQITQMKMAADEAAGGTGGDSAQSARMLRLMRMAKLTKLARMRKLAKVLESFEEYLNPSVLAVFKLVFILLFCCHLFGCLWWMISDLEIAEELDGASSYSWMNTPYYAIESSGKNEWHPPHWLKNEASVTMKYMHAFFWGAGMITSLGERHVNPVTVVELIVTCAIMFFALMLNAFVISSLNQALASMNAKAELTGKQIAAIKSYLTIKQVPKVLRGRILEYYHYVLGSSAALEDMNLFESMPAALTTQLSLTTNKRLALSCTFFHKVSNEALVSLLRGFEAAVFIPAQRVAKQGMALKNVYFINRGIVKISTHDGTERTISNNENCGLDDYWTGSISNERPQCSGTADAITYCDIMCLEVKLMDKALERDKAYLRNVKEARRAAAAAQAAAKVAAMRRKSSQGGKKGPKVKSKKVPSSWFGSGSGAGTKGAFPTLKTLIKLKKHREANLPEPMLPPKHPRGSYDEILAMSRDLAQVLREMDKQTPPMVHYKLREVFLRAMNRIDSNGSQHGNSPQHGRRGRAKSGELSGGGSGGGGGGGGGGGSGGGGGGSGGSNVGAPPSPAAALESLRPEDGTNVLDYVAETDSARSRPSKLAARNGSCGNDVGAAPSALKIRRREDGADEDYVAEAAASAREMSTCDSARSRPGKVSARSVSMRDSGGIALSDRKSGTSFPGGGGGGSASGSLTTPGPTDGVVQRLFEVPTSEAQRPPVGVAAAPNSLDVIC